MTSREKDHFAVLTCAVEHRESMKLSRAKEVRCESCQKSKSVGFSQNMPRNATKLCSLAYSVMLLRTHLFTLLFLDHSSKQISSLRPSSSTVQIVNEISIVMVRKSWKVEKN